MRRDALWNLFSDCFFSSGDCRKLRIRSLRLGLGVRLGGKENIFWGGGEHVGNQRRLG